VGWPPEDLEHLQIIRSSGTHLLGLINSVLEMSKVEAGKLALSPVSVDVPTSVRTPRSSRIRDRAAVTVNNLGGFRHGRVPRRILRHAQGSVGWGVSRVLAAVCLWW
jgi:signal transduction histidine kinase